MDPAGSEGAKRTGANGTRLQEGNMRFRSAGATKSVQEEALQSLKAVSKSPVKSKTLSPDQALLGALIAVVFGVLLYKFTTSIEYTPNHQKLLDNYSVKISPFDGILSENGKRLRTCIKRKKKKATK
ncbi:UNVERIFIED_CONTAM: hypothetical protein Sradi_0726000 [Sesamum radiatum]|uniref:Uncharacterized protein n=1 Tax=Sesamum radiatum TaxID=300843 RepID=A0AAW2VQE9_SESRA